MNPTRAVRSPLPLLLPLVLTACMAQPGVKELEENNARLERRLEQASDAITDLRVSEERLREQLEERERVIDVLHSEKSSRVEESTQLRGLVREFVQGQIDRYRDFLLQADLLDYVGSERVSRSQHSEEALTLVDLAHPMPSAGTLTGLAGYFEGPGKVVVNVLRPVGDELVVVWESPVTTVTGGGEVRASFPVTVGVEPGDIVAYEFNGVVPVGFDEGTGDTRYQREPLSVGDRVDPDELDGRKERRAYSIGVFGLLN